MSMKNPPTPAGIEPATFRIVAQHLNHCATAVPDFVIRIHYYYYYYYYLYSDYHPFQRAHHYISHKSKTQYKFSLLQNLIFFSNAVSVHLSRTEALQIHSFVSVTRKLLQNKSHAIESLIFFLPLCFTKYSTYRWEKI